MKIKKQQVFQFQYFNRENRITFDENKQLQLKKINIANLKTKEQRRRFTENHYGIPSISDSYTNSQKQLELRSDSSKVTKQSRHHKTICQHCLLKTQNVSFNRPGDASLCWAVLLLVVGACCLPFFISTCHDQEIRCIKCWEIKNTKKGKICFKC